MNIVKLNVILNSYRECAETRGIEANDSFSFNLLIFSGDSSLIIMLVVLLL